MTSQPNTIAPGDHRAYMLHALNQAKLSPPSPSKFCVGGVLVDADKNEILSTGYSEELPRDRPNDPGSTHAEHCCFIKVGDAYGISDFDIAQVLPPNTVLYTTMEPCNERLSGSRTCTERIPGLGNAIKAVYTGIREPDTFIKVNNGIKRLESAGIKVVLMDEDEELRARILGFTLVGMRKRKCDGKGAWRASLSHGVWGSYCRGPYLVVEQHGPAPGKHRVGLSLHLVKVEPEIQASHAPVHVYERASLSRSLS